MSRNKHGSAVKVNVRNDDIEGALKRLSKINGGVISNYRKVMDHYEKPSTLRHQKMQSMLHKLKLEREGKVTVSNKRNKSNRRIEDR